MPAASPAGTSTTSAPHVAAPYAYASWLYQRTGGDQGDGRRHLLAQRINSTTLDQVEGGIGVVRSSAASSGTASPSRPSVDLAYGRLGGDVAFPVGFELLGTTVAASAADIGRDVFRVGAQLDVVRFDELVGGFLGYDGRFQENAQNNTFSGGILVRF